MAKQSSIKKILKDWLKNGKEPVTITPLGIIEMEKQIINLLPKYSPHKECINRSKKHCWCISDCVDDWNQTIKSMTRRDR